MKAIPPLLLLALVLAARPARAAEPPAASPWRIYRAADGLTESLTTAITLTPRGNLWVKHGEVDAVTFLDGYTTRHVPAPGQRHYRVYESRAGKIWSLYPQGLLEFINDEWQRRPLEEFRLLPELSARVAPQVPLLPAEQDRVLLLLPDRLAEYHSLANEFRVLRWARETRLGRFLDLLPAGDGGLWISASNGLARLPGPLKQIGPQTAWSEHLVPDGLGLRQLQRPFEDDDGGLTAVAELAGSDRRGLAHFDGTNWTSLAVPGESLRYAWRDTERGHFWGLTFTTLLRLEPAGPNPSACRSHRTSISTSRSSPAACSGSPRSKA